MPLPSARILISPVAAPLLCALLPERGGTDGWSLFPPVLAIVVAVASGRLVWGLCLALFSGALIALPAEVPFYVRPLHALHMAAIDFVWTPLRESFQLFILGFTASLIGMVRVISLAGGTRGIAEAWCAEQPVHAPLVWQRPYSVWPFFLTIMLIPSSLAPRCDLLRIGFELAERNSPISLILPQRRSPAWQLSARGSVLK